MERKKIKKMNREEGAEARTELKRERERESGDRSRSREERD